MKESISTQHLTIASKVIAEVLGLHFPPEKWPDLERALRETIKSFDFNTIPSFIDWISSRTLEQSEIENLACHFTVGETYFFRDKSYFNILENKLLPLLIEKRKNTEKVIRIWSAGCSSGEEPYSLAILLIRMIPDIKNWNITILASDINSTAQNKLMKGIYTDWSFRSVDKTIKDNYFSKIENNRYLIKPEIKNLVTPIYLNLITDVYPSLLNNTNAMDIIFCRNVLMYFVPEKVASVIKKLSNALINGGYLFVGGSEYHLVQNLQLQMKFSEGVSYYRKVPPPLAPPPKGGGEEKVTHPTSEGVEEKTTLFPLEGEQEKRISLPLGADEEEEIPHLKEEQLHSSSGEIHPTLSGRTEAQQLTSTYENKKSTSDDAEKNLTSADAGNNSLPADAGKNLTSADDEKNSTSADAEKNFAYAEKNLPSAFRGRDLSSKSPPPLGGGIKGGGVEAQARTLANRGELHDALTLLEHGIMQDNCNKHLYYLKALILLELGSLPEAIKELRKTIYLDHNFVLAYFTLGNIFRQQGNTNEAKQIFNTILTLLKKYSVEEILPDSEGMSAGKMKEIVELMKTV